MSSSNSIIILSQGQGINRTITFLIFIFSLWVHHVSVCVELMSTADENASRFKKCSLANIYLRGTGLIMVFSKNFSQKKCICVYKYIEFSYQKL